MKNTKFLSKLSLILCITLIAAMVCTMVSCDNKKEDEETKAETSIETTAETTGSNVLGEGDVAFTFTVRDGESKEVFEIRTDKATVGEALIELGLIEGEEGPYGLYVKKVNGITADFDVDGTYWAFYIDGEYAMTGVDTTEVEDGREYTFSKEK